MFGLEAIQTTTWVLCQIVLVGLAISLFRSENYRRYPFFTFYTLANLSQGVFLLARIYVWHKYPAIDDPVAWATILVTLLARALAAMELCHRVLANYDGIWALAWRLLTLCAAIILAYSLFVGNLHWGHGVYAADRAMQLAVAGVIALLFVFCRYYKVSASRSDRFLGLGLFLYSGVVVLSHTLLERFFKQYTPFWNLTILLAFFVSTTVWIRALWSPASQRSERPVMLRKEIYQALSPEINLRLRRLDQQLLSLWKREAPNS
jgi:uncharacterized membrane protein YgdD (TMEM256/DUF423 family)